MRDALVHTGPLWELEPLSLYGFRRILKLELIIFLMCSILKFKHFILHGISLLFFAPRTEEAQSQKPHEPEVRSQKPKASSKNRVLKNAKKNQEKRGEER